MRCWVVLLLGVLCGVGLCPVSVFCIHSLPVVLYFMVFPYFRLLARDRDPVASPFGPFLLFNLVAAYSAYMSRPNLLVCPALAKLRRGRQSTCRCRPVRWLIFLGFVEGLCVGIASSRSLVGLFAPGLRPFAESGWSSMHLA